MTVNKELLKYIESLEHTLSRDRQYFHTYPEVGWTEVRTAAVVMERLTSLGFDVKYGKSVIAASERMGLPTEAVLKEHFERTLMTSGIPEASLTPFKDGFTGVVGSINFGEGPIIGLRFDMDALKLTESNEEKHQPSKNGFISVHEGIMHACGHDGHTAIGLAVADVLSHFKDTFKYGGVKLIFQPAEEGVRGAKSMVASGVLDDVTHVFACHLMADIPYGKIICGTNGFMATSKMDVIFTGKPSHAGASPDQGKNALLAACTATLNLHAIPRHHKGASRINVGTLNAGTDRNVIADKAVLKIETRGENTEINDYMRQHAQRIIDSSAVMYGVASEVTFVGEAIGGYSDEIMIDHIEDIAKQLTCFSEIERTSSRAAGSEDFSYMMKAVQDRGGKAAYFSIGAAVDAKGRGHHTTMFDINESAMTDSVKVFASIVTRLLSDKK